jgi:hypothetical protein
MNIVQVRHLQDKNAKRYTYKVPENKSLNKGDMVLTRNVNGKESVAICVTDSENLSTNAIDMIMCGAEVLSEVIGIYKCCKFETESEIDLENIIGEYTQALTKYHTATNPEV